MGTPVDFEAICKAVGLGADCEWTRTSKQMEQMKMRQANPYHPRHPYHHRYIPEQKIERKTGNPMPEIRFRYAKAFVQQFLGTILDGWVRDLTDLVTDYMPPIPSEYFLNVFESGRSVYTWLLQPIPKAWPLQGVDAMFESFQFRSVTNQFGFASNIDFDGGDCFRFSVAVKAPRLLAVLCPHLADGRQLLSLPYFQGGGPSLEALGNRISIKDPKDKEVLANVYATIYHAWRGSSANRAECNLIEAQAHDEFEVVNLKKAEIPIKSFAILRIQSICDTSHGPHVNVVIEDTYDAEINK